MAALAAGGGVVSEAGGVIGLGRPGRASQHALLSARSSKSIAASLGLEQFLIETEK